MSKGKSDKELEDVADKWGRSNYPLCDKPKTGYPTFGGEAFKAGAEWYRKRSVGDSIKFGEWLFHNTYEARWKNEEKRYLNKDSNPYSTEQLYEMWQLTQSNIE